MARYGKAASKRVESAVRRQKRGTLKSGSGGTVRSRKQAIAIGLSEAREKCGKVPPAGRRARKRSTKSGGRTRSVAKTASARKTRSSRKSSGARKR